MARILTRRWALTGLLCGTVGLAFAAPSARSAKTDVTGTIVDYDRKVAILVLSDYADWNRKQMDRAVFLEGRSTQRWFKSLDKAHAVIYIKKDDMKALRKGKRIRITGYSYFTDEWAVFPSYSKLEVIK